MGFVDNANLKDIIYKKQTFSNSDAFRKKLVYIGYYGRIEDFPEASHTNEGAMCSTSNGDVFICTGTEWTKIGDVNGYDSDFDGYGRFAYINESDSETEE